MTFGTRVGDFTTKNMPSFGGSSLGTYYRATSLSLWTDSPGASIFWVGGSGDWFTNSNWSTGVVPGSADNVYIGVVGVTVTYSSGVDQVLSLVNDQTLNITGGSLTIGGGSAGGSAFNLESGGTLDG